MTSKERLAAFYEGRPVDRLPNLTIVGSVVTRYNGIDIETYAKDWQKMADAAMLAAEDLDLDFVQIAADLVREAEGYGSIIAYSPDNLPSVKELALKELSDVDRLAPLKARDIPRLYDMVRATAYALEKSGDIWPMTLAVGPMTVAGNLRGVQTLMMDLYDDPDRVNRLLDLITGTTLDYIRELAAAGAKYIYVADPSASLVGPRFYKNVILPRHQQIFGLMKELGIHSRLHMCGNTGKILPFSAGCGAEIIDIDHDTDFAKALETVGDRAILNGNIDPIGDVFSATPEHTREAMREAYRVAAGRKAMIMPGCELPTATPLENVKAIAEAIRDFGPSVSSDADVKELVENGSVSVAVRSAGGKAASAAGHTVLPLVTLLKEQPDLFPHSYVADRVVGKGVASLLVCANVREVHASLISESGLALLQEHGIPVTYTELTPVILNNRGDGTCPVEAMVKDIETVWDCAEAVMRFAEQL